MVSKMVLTPQGRGQGYFPKGRWTDLQIRDWSARGEERQEPPSGQDLQGTYKNKLREKMTSLGWNHVSSTTYPIGIV